MELPVLIIIAAVTKQHNGNYGRRCIYTSTSASVSYNRQYC